MSHPPSVTLVESYQDFSHFSHSGRKLSRFGHPRGQPFEFTCINSIKTCKIVLARGTSRCIFCRSNLAGKCCTVPINALRPVDCSVDPEYESFMASKLIESNDAQAAAQVSFGESLCSKFCSRCGRSSHTAKFCYASYHVDRSRISSEVDDPPRGRFIANIQGSSFDAPEKGSWKLLVDKYAGLQTQCVVVGSRAAEEGGLGKGEEVLQEEVEKG